MTSLNMDAEGARPAVAGEPLSCELREHEGRDRVGAVCRDSLFLFLIVFISAGPYLWGLGFYSDDWPFLAGMTGSRESTVGATFAALYQDEIRMRPVQILILAVLFRLFGLEPLGYHIVNTALLGAGIVLCYLVLRELRIRREIALAVALVFGLLPHYSTDRFWVAAIQVTLSMTLYSLSLYADLRATRSSPAGSWGWRALALAVMIGSVLAYEVWLPLFLLNVLLAFVQARRSARVEGRRVPAAMRLPVLLATTVLALLPVLLWKLQFATRLTSVTLEQRVASFRWLLKGSAAVSYGEYGIGLPFVVARILHHYPSAVVSATAVGVALIVFPYLWRVTREAAGGGRSGGAALALVGVGFGVFFLGYAVFFFTQNAQYAATGISNRVAIAAALGVALGWVGGIVVIGLPMRRKRLRDAVFAGGVAVAAGTNVLIIGTVGTFWGEAYRREQRILHEIRLAFPDLPSETTLILDGVCPYVGPAVVFDASWDLAGALRIIYGDYTIRADVVTPNLTVEETGLKASLYGGRLVTEYPYRRMLLYHAGLRHHFVLEDANAARRYFRAYNPTRDGNCSPGREGHGVRIF
jgi:hypothetical protein